LISTGIPLDRVGTFLFIGRCLRTLEQSDRAELAQLISARRIDWELALSLGSQHFVLPLLFCALRREGLLALLPPAIQDCLEGTYQLNTLRTGELEGQIIDLARVLNGVSVTPILLKGAGALFLGLYEDAGLRMMSDVDVLVTKDRLSDCLKALTRRGYRPTAADYPPGFHHHAPLVCDDYATAVELHTQAVPRAFAALLPTAEIWAAARPAELGMGASALLPSPTHFLLNNVIRSQLARGGRDVVRMYHLWDVVALRQAGDAAIDWGAIRARFDRAGYGTALRTHLWTIEQLFGQPCPAAVPPTWAARLQWRALLWSLRSARLMVLWRAVSYLGASLHNLRRRPDLRRELLRPDRWLRRYRAEVGGQLYRDTW
jgi:hypothetical protein